MKKAGFIALLAVAVFIFVSGSGVFAGTPVGKSMAANSVLVFFLLLFLFSSVVFIVLRKQDKKFDLVYGLLLLVFWMCLLAGSVLLLTLLPLDNCGV